LISLLGSNEAFSSAPAAALEILVDAGELTELEADQVMIREGASGESVWLLVEGDVEVTIGDRLVNRLDTSGEILGEISAVSQVPATATVRLLTGGSALRIPQQKLHLVMEQFPQLAASMLRSMSKYLS
jgi:CRP-like cAMP-binding protein